ncbi:MAG: transposase family protein [Methylocella sp.]
MTVLFSIFAIVSGANSYRGIRTFIKVHRPQLNRAFKIRWKRPPAHTAIRYILQGLSPADVENVFRLLIPVEAAHHNEMMSPTVTE